MLSEKEIRDFLVEIFRKFKSDYPMINPKGFIVNLAQMYGSQVPQTSMSTIKYNLVLDVIQEMYGKKT